MTPPDQMGAAPHAHTAAAPARKALIFANDKSSGKATTPAKRRRSRDWFAG